MVHNFTKLHRIVITLFVIVIALALTYCSDELQKEENSMNKKSIEEVMNSHSDEIMAMKGVAGIYIGQLENGKPCIVVMIIRKSEELNKKIPKTLEGYPVKIEVSGEIKPM